MLSSDTLLRHQKDHTGDSPAAAVDDQRRSSHAMTVDTSQVLPNDAVALGGTTILPEGSQVSTIEPSVDIYQNPFASNQLSSGIDMSLDAFNFDLEAQFPSWLVDSDLHNGILDTPLVATMAELRPGWPESPYAAFGGPTNYKPVSSMKRIWFTANEEGEDGIPQSGPATPPGSRDEVDDSYRQTLTQSLQIRPLKEQTALPSADFLNL